MSLVLIIILVLSLVITLVKPKFYQRFLNIDSSHNVVKGYYAIWLVLFVFSIVSSPPPLEKLNQYFSLKNPESGEVNAPIQKNTPDPLQPENKFVTKIIDGDTVVVAGGDHVRLLGIDADEPAGACHEAAKTRLTELVYGKELELRPDQSDKDQYGRLLRYLFLDGQNINFLLVGEGLAVCRFYPDNPSFKQECAQAEIKAINEKTGCLWTQ